MIKVSAMNIDLLVNDVEAYHISVLFEDDKDD
jgi:hypothetical protein